MEKRRINFLIDHQCPQCGAPATLDETDRLFRCDYCKVSSYLAPHRYYRYRLPDKAPRGKRLIYFPYWRFKGMLFSCLASGIEHRFLDISRQAVAAPCFPASLGLRSQAMKLRFVSPENEGWFIRPAQPFGQVMTDILARHNRDLPHPILHQAHIGESVSLIYAPFYGDERLMDAVLNVPVAPDSNPPFDSSEFDGGAADWRLHFIPTLCPNCGWDMQGNRDAIVLHCPNCASLWQAATSGMQRINVAHMPTREQTVIYLPFWRLRAEVSGLKLDSYADLVRTANLPKVVQPMWEQQPFYFWSPAFKVRPRTFLRLTQQMTLSQPGDPLMPEIPQGTLHGVNLPVREAVETLKLNLAGFMRPKKVMQSRIADIAVTAKRYLLVYLPFSVRHHDLVSTDFNIAVNRSQLALAGNL